MNRATAMIPSSWCSACRITSRKAVSPLTRQAIRSRPTRVRHASYIAAIDQGTSSTRVILYDTASGLPVGSHQIAITVKTPQPGWAQIDPDEILTSVETCAAGALAKCNASSSDVVGVGITNQRETTVVWDRRTGKPLHDAVVWLDSRTRGTVGSLVDEHEGDTDVLRATTGLPLSTYFTGVKLRWLLDNIPAVKNAVQTGDALVGTVDSWLIWKLTNGGTHATDFTNASRTMLMNLNNRTWDAACAETLGITSMLGALPEIRSSAESYGVVTMPGSAFLGIAITGVIGDQQSAMVGQRCFREGMAKTTYGTGAFALKSTGPQPFPSTHGLLTTALCQLGPSAPPLYALEGSVGACAVGQDWFCNKLDMFDNAQQMHELASTVPAGANGVYFVSAFGGLLAPRWRDDARGTLVGLTLAHTKADVGRAVVEGIAHQVREVIESMVQDSGFPLASMRVDGGVSNSNSLLQFQADLLNTKVERPRDIETTALGASLCAGVGAGVWTPEQVADEVTAAENSGHSIVERVFECDMDTITRTALCTKWNRAVEASFGWAE
eukprot:m.19000 g.19000  ORF g.19000 m.19000 type:complete len:554 (-) comp12300_c0_seq1:81-1742(-)